MFRSNKVELCATSNQRQKERTHDVWLEWIECLKKWNINNLQSNQRQWELHGSVGSWRNESWYMMGLHGITARTLSTLFSFRCFSWENKTAYLNKWQMLSKNYKYCSEIKVKILRENKKRASADGSRHLLRCTRCLFLWITQDLLFKGAFHSVLKHGHESYQPQRMCLMWWW